jgi:hypothetical protein
VASIGAAAPVVVLVGVSLADDVGAKRTLYLARVAASARTPCLFVILDVRSLFFCGTLLGTSMGLFLTFNWAVANQLAPDESARAFLGPTNLTAARASALARLRGPAIDPLNAARPSLWPDYRTLFLICPARILRSAHLLNRIPTGTPRHYLYGAPPVSGIYNSGHLGFKGIPRGDPGRRSGPQMAGDRATWCRLPRIPR